LEFCGRVCAVLTFLRDKSRAPAAILVGALNTYVGEADGGFAFSLASKRSLGRRDACPTLATARLMVPMHGIKVVGVFHEPQSATGILPAALFSDR